jgi:cytochrome c oxidase subunit 2
MKFGLVTASSLGLLGAPASAEPSMSYWRTFGPSGDAGTTLGWGLGIVSIVVTVLVAASLLIGVLRRRRKDGDPRSLAVRTDSGGMAWIYTGLGLTVAVLIVFAVWTMFTIAAVAMPAKTTMTLQVTASQWWWSVRYDSPQPSQIFSVANEIHIPVGQPIRVELSSPDVIHSFWIPQLGGKMDVIPGQANVTWLQADKPGVYRGQCGEFCGAQHAHMAMLVVADAPQAFAAWKADQLRAAVPPTTPEGQSGRSAFVAHCAACHAVRGADAGGILGPDLTHLMSRRTIAAGLLPNTPGNLSAWIADAQALKPGTRMPSMVLPAPELTAIVAYLETLQ